MTHDVGKVDGVLMLVCELGCHCGLDGVLMLVCELGCHCGLNGVLMLESMNDAKLGCMCCCV